MRNHPDYAITGQAHKHIATQGANHFVQKIALRNPSKSELDSIILLTGAGLHPEAAANLAFDLSLTRLLR